MILECRITVCYKMFCQIHKRVLACRALHVLQNVWSPTRFAFCASLARSNRPFRCLEEITVPIAPSEVLKKFKEENSGTFVESERRRKEIV